MKYASLAAAFPRGVILDGALSCKLKLFLSGIEAAAGKTKAESVHELFTKLANVTAQQAWNYDENEILDSGKVPGSYILERPAEVMEILHKLGDLVTESIGGGYAWEYFEKSEFEKLTLEVESYAWTLARKAKYIEI